MRPLFFLMLCVALGACTGSGADQAPPPLVRILSGDDHCSVKGVEVPCSSVPVYLRDKLKLAPDTIVDIGAGSEIKGTEDLEKLAAAVRGAGYEYVMLVIEVPNTRK